MDKPDASFLSETTNRNLKRLLLKRDMLPTIETVLRHESEKLQELQEKKAAGKLDFGNRLSVDERFGLYPEIADEVDALLGIDDTKMPRLITSAIPEVKIFAAIPAIIYITFITKAAPMLEEFRVEGHPEYYNWAMFGVFASIAVAIAGQFAYNGISYSRASNNLSLGRTTAPDMVYRASHSHAMFRVKGQGFPSEREVFNKGLQRGVQNRVSQTYSEKTGNPAYAFIATNARVANLVRAYNWMCRQLGETPNKEVLPPQNITMLSVLSESLGKDSLNAKIGHALFAAYEHLHGPDVYNQMIHGQFKFA